MTESSGKMQLKRNCIRSNAWMLRDSESPNSKKWLDSKIALVKKRGETGTVCKYKSSIVVCGKERVDYLEKRFSAVVNY